MGFLVGKLYRKKSSGKVEIVSEEDDFFHMNVNEYQEEVHSPVIILSKDEFEDLKKSSGTGSQLDGYVTGYIVTRYAVKRARGES